MKKILLVFGTRPEAIKIAPFVLAFKQYSKEMIDHVLQTFSITSHLCYVLNQPRNI